MSFRTLDEHTQVDASHFSISVDTNGNKELEVYLTINDDIILS
jgi:hypothetical protein